MLFRCQIAILIHFSNEVDVLYSKENNPWTGGLLVPLPEGFWARLSLENIRRGKEDTEHDWLGGQGFP